MEGFNIEDLRKLYIPPAGSHKGNNGKLMIIGGSHLFHGASLWALKVASRIVDMVFYASIPENITLTQKLKSEIYDFIAIPREEIEKYMDEADCVLIGSGMVRTEKSEIRDLREIRDIREIGGIKDEGEQTCCLTEYLLHKYPHKKWVIDAGSLQMMEPEWLKMLNGNVIITPHRKEFEKLFNIKNQKSKIKNTDQPFDFAQGKSSKIEIETVQNKALEYNTIILLKGVEDVVCSPLECVRISGGNAGMTKGGTGDVLAGLVAALSCKNDLFLAAKTASYINKKAGEELFKRAGCYFNASDLADEIPKVMKILIIRNKDKGS